MAGAPGACWAVLQERRERWKRPGLPQDHDVVAGFARRLGAGPRFFWLHARQATFIIAKVTGDEVDLRWDAFVTAMLASGAVHERRSRYADKPALFLDRREIAHLEAPGVIDLRISRKGWAQAHDDYRDSPLVRHDPSRRDWIELHLHSPADLDALASLLAIAIAANS